MTEPVVRRQAAERALITVVSVAGTTATEHAPSREAPLSEHAQDFVGRVFRQHFFPYAASVGEGCPRANPEEML